MSAVSPHSQERMVKTGTGRRSICLRAGAETTWCLLVIKSGKWLSSTSEDHNRCTPSAYIDNHEAERVKHGVPGSADLSPSFLVKEHPAESALPEEAGLLSHRILTSFCREHADSYQRYQLQHHG